MKVHRREFLKGALAVAVGSTAARGDFFTAVRRPTGGIISLGNRKELFLDDAMIASSSNLSKFLRRPEKYIDNPVLKADRPWEPLPGEKGGHGVGVPSVMYDEDEKIFKMWYLSSGPTGRSFACYATSVNGYEWEKPELGLVDYAGSKRNNIWSIYADPTFTDFFKDYRETDPKRRYKAMGEWERGATANKDGGLVIAFSEDGLRWTFPDRNPVLAHGANFGDAPAHAFWDPLRGRYVCYPRPGHLRAPEIDGVGYHRHLRSIGYSESDDFLTWTPTRPMIVPGAENRIDSQFESFRSVMRGSFYIGFVPVRQSYERTFEIFLVSSRDGFNWSWLDESKAFLPRGEVGSYDGAGMGGCCPVVHDNRVWMYYSSARYRYTSSVNIRPGTYDQSAVCLATCPVDQCAGLMAGLHLGTLVTHPVIFSGRELQVDLEPAVPVDLDKALARGQGGGQPPGFDTGEVRVALLDQSGGQLAGFTKEKCTPLTHSGPQKVTWERADLAALSGQPVRLRFEMRNVVLHGFQFV